MQVWPLDQEDPLQECMATHSGILAWRIPCTEEPGELQSNGSQRIGHDWSEHARTEEMSPADVGHVGEHMASSEASSDTCLLVVRAQRRQTHVENKSPLHKPCPPLSIPKADMTNASQHWAFSGLRAPVDPVFQEAPVVNQSWHSW